MTIARECANRLAELNSATKYPSIPTYHVLGEKGRLTEERACEFDAQDVCVAEKIDGANARIVAFADGSYLIGSRTEWLTAKGDLIANAALGIAEATRDAALGWADHARDRGFGVAVLYGEVYGGKVNAASKQYTGCEALGFRAFDAWTMSLADLAIALSGGVEALAAWRDAGGQPFMDYPTFIAACRDCGIDRVPLFGVGVGVEPPVAVNATREWLKTELLPGSLATLDGGGQGLPEGVVVRNASRTKIAKIRREDYGLRGRRESW